FPRLSKAGDRGWLIGVAVATATQPISRIGMKLSRWPPIRSICRSQLLYDLADLGDHLFRITNHLGVFKAQYFDTDLLQYRIPPCIIFDGMVMVYSIDLDRESHFRAIEIDDEAIDTFLSAKFRADANITKAAPEHSLATRCAVALIAAEVFHALVVE